MVFKCYVFVSRQIFHLQYCLKDLKQVASYSWFSTSIVIFDFFCTAPEVVIYDNGCNLHSYSLNREPDHFTSTWFVIDRFHWPNHTGIDTEML